MRRRTLLTGLGGLAGTAVLGAPAAADPLASLETILLSPPANPAAPAAGVHGEVAAVRTLFQHGRYREVTTALPRLLPAAIAAHNHSTTARHAADLAELYTLSTELLVKVGHDHLAWTTADRALQAAYASGDVLTAATARRAWGMVLRRAGRAEVANRLVIDTAVELQHHTARGGTEHLVVYGSLLATAAYTAATRGDRDTAHTLIGEAVDTARHTGHTTRRGITFGPTAVDLYRISSALVTM